MALLNGFYTTGKAQEWHRYKDIEVTATAVCTLVTPLGISFLYTRLYHEENTTLSKPFLTPKATLSLPFTNHYLEPFRADSLGSGAACICKVPHHHAQERTQET